MTDTVANVLVLSGAASAVNYINTLADDPSVQLHVTDSDPYCPGFFSRGVIPAWLPRARDTAAYRAALDHLIDERRIDVLIPTSDYDVAAVVSYLHDGWAPKVRLFRPSLEAERALSNKQEFAERLAKTMPEVLPVTLMPTEVGGDVSLPVVIKPVEESGGKGVSIVLRAEDFGPAFARAKALYGDKFVVQQFIPGRTYVATLVYDEQGHLVVAVAMRSTLTFFTWGGGGCAGELFEAPELLRMSDRVIQACGGWRGPVNLEWRDPGQGGRYYVMEANCRLNGYSYLTTMNGIEMPKIVLALLLGKPVPTVELPLPGKRRNFVIGYRETPIANWLVDVDA
jgi:carbamoyl-phosphate synthase large subunit